jgi:hypothetical protein
MSYIPTGFSPQEQTLIIETQEKIYGNTAEIIKRQKEEEKRRRWALGLGAIGALIAAARLGLVAIPFFKERRLGKL